MIVTMNDSSCLGLICFLSGHERLQRLRCGILAGSSTGLPGPKGQTDTHQAHVGRNRPSARSLQHSRGSGEAGHPRLLQAYFPSDGLGEWGIFVCFVPVMMHCSDDHALCFSCVTTHAIPSLVCDHLYVFLSCSWVFMCISPCHIYLYPPVVMHGAGDNQGETVVDVLHFARRVCGRCTTGVQQCHRVQPSVALRAHMGGSSADRIRGESEG